MYDWQIYNFRASMSAVLVAKVQKQNLAGRNSAKARTPKRIGAISIAKHIGFSIYDDLRTSRF
jgi:predicted transcriptional regulator